MSAHTIVFRFCRTTAARAVAGSVALLLPLAAVALDPAPARSLSVSVFSDRYVAAGRQFSDLDALEGWVKSASPRVLRLDGCGAASAARLLATVERFQHSYLDIRMSEAGDAGCTTVAAGRSIPAAIRQQPPGHHDFAVDRYWRNVAP
jgi:hypothetical protein